MIILSKEQIIALHSQLVSETGGSDGIRDISLLESALSAPFQVFDGTEAYPSIQQKAARLGFGLVQNHAFVDRNKRIGAHLMLVLLSQKHIELEYTQQELSDTILKIAGGEYSFNDLLKWILDHQL